MTQKELEIRNLELKLNLAQKRDQQIIKDKQKKAKDIDRQIAEIQDMLKHQSKETAILQDEIS